MAYSTPGVYIKEISKFPPSIAQVETAVPAFIGHTAKAQDPNKKNLTNIPTKIKSLLDFELLFGEAYLVEEFTVKIDTTEDNQIMSVLPDERFYLYDCLKHYFDNGGGECYIVSVDNFDNAPSYSKFETGLDALEKFDEPTIIVFPDAVSFLDGSDDPDFTALGDLQKRALAQCNKLQDRFVVMDLMNGHLPEDTTNKPITEFRNNIGTSFLKYGAAYYPWIRTSFSYGLMFNQLKFVDETDADITDLTPFSNGDATLEAMVTDLEGKTNNVNSIITDIHEHDEMNLVRGSEPIDSHLKSLAVTIASNTTLISATTSYLEVLSTLALVFHNRDGNVNDDLQLEIDKLKEDTDLQDAIVGLIELELNSTVISKTHAARDAAAIDTKYNVLDNTDWIGGVAFSTITADTTDFDSGASGHERNLAIIAALGEYKEQLIKSFYTLFNSAQSIEKNAQDTVFGQHSFFKSISEQVTLTMATVPPSATMAGIYCAVDEARGVFKSPANISVNSVLGPTVKLDSDDQSSLNVHVTGKSINVIRAFTGKGTLVWGGRTLDGNSNEWKYISVRRFFNMVEESVKKATEPFVFEPNDANTWVKVSAMIENFLIVQWRAGALVGSKPNEAFHVNIGLGKSMTALDVLEGRMNVEIGMAVVRPAEFIILKFSHKMQES